MSQHKINRRKFLQYSAAGAAGLVLASCTTPTAAPVAQATNTTAAAGAATQPAVAATPTPIPAVVATATSVPTLATAKFNEAPMLADKVKAGTLPPIDQRLPASPLVLAPVDGVGKYGGRLRTISNYAPEIVESQYGYSGLRWINDGLGIAPGLCDTWSANTDDSVWTFHIRQGVKWSDGQPVTVDDVMFWWNDICNVTGSGETPPDFGLDTGSKLATFTKKDDFTLEIAYTAPHPLTAKRVAMWANGIIGPSWIMPMHYLKQFHPKYNTAVKDFTTFNQKKDPSVNADVPTLLGWTTTKVVPSQSVTLDRNPYYYVVDTQGNQLPYLDGMDYTFINDPQVELTQVLQGSVDLDWFVQWSLADVSTLKDNESKGNYDTRLYDTGSGTAMMYFWNYDTADPVKRALYRNPQFKQAVSFAMDRPTIQKTVYFNTGILTTGTMSPKAIEFNYNSDAQDHYKKYRDAYVAYDPAKANSMLDALGMKKGADGFRTFPDGSKFEFRVDVQADAGKECLAVLQITQKNWQDVGLNAIINQIPPADFDPGWDSGKYEFRTNWEVGDGPDHMLYPSWVVPNEQSRWAPLCGELLALAGTAQDNTECDKQPWERKPPRYCKTDKDYAGTPVEKLQGIYLQALVEVDDVKRMSLVWQMDDIHYDNLFYLGTVANYPRAVAVSKNMMNMPTHDQLKLGGFVNPWIIPFPAVMNPETFSYK